MRPIQIARRALLVLLSALLLGACSGGGGGGGAGGGVSSALSAYVLRVHYHRADATYTGWGVYSWQGTTNPTPTWPANTPFNQTDAFGVYVDLPIDHAQPVVDFLVTDGQGNKNCGSDQSLTLAASIAAGGQEIWIAQADCTLYASAAAALSPIKLGSAQAVWLQPDTMVWPGASATASYKLYYAANGGMAPSTNAPTGADGSYDLAAGAPLGGALAAKFPQYAGAATLTVPAAAVANVASLLKGQLAVVVSTGGSASGGTQVQVAPVLDAVYAGAASVQTLGVSFDANDVPTFRLWAPTATAVTLKIYASPTATTPAKTVAMTPDAASGVWSATAADNSWTNTAYYTFDITAYSRSAGSVVVTSTDVTDPYAPSLNGNGQYGMVLNLADAVAKPTGWPGTLPKSGAATDDSVYELHIRDFSANDATVGAGHAGKYLAFTDLSANGMKHLAALAQAGLTHVHLLPTFDFASVNELGCTTPTIPASIGADLTAANAVVATQNADCFNWGYDPAHYGAPEGSYASDASNGLTRVREFRQMVAALHGVGLRVVMDVVYNHTYSTDALEKIVPGYYYRLDGNGAIENDSCCADTASEFAMMAKLMQDTLVRWAGQYKVDGFRFDIMGFSPLPTIEAAKTAVDAVLAADGRGASLFYGEGWNFGHVANNKLFVQASQLNLAGSGIGSFNDRMRDSVRGGSPFDSGAALVSNQGFVNGLCYDNNDGSACTSAQRSTLQAAQNLIRLSLAGNLKDYNLSGTLGSAYNYGGQPAGYTRDPTENVPYVSVHDNETLFDISQYKHPAATSTAARARAQVVGLSLVALSQGIAFFHAGDDLLRSKSLDSNSYNSGDYFNRIYWDGSANNFGVGAPPQNTGNNAANLATATPILAQPAPAPTDNLAAAAAFQDFLKIRGSTSKFRLGTGVLVKSCVNFPDAAAQQDGLVVMRIAGAGCGDATYKSIVVLFNANKAAQSYTIAAYQGNASVALHPVQAAGSDPVVKGASFSAVSGTFTVPARTTAVFVEN